MSLRTNLRVMAALLTISLAPTVLADQLTLVGVFSGRTGGANPTEYLTPYKLSINGGPVVLGICDDFWTNISVGSTWTAAANNLSNPSVLKFGDQGVEKYYQAAYLGNLLLSVDLTKSGTLADQTALSFAIWQLFNNKTTDSPFNHLSGTPQILAQAKLYLEQAKGATANSFAGWTVYTPNPLTASQEMLVHVPEAPAVALLGLNIAALLGLAAIFRRRIQLS